VLYEQKRRSQKGSPALRKRGWRAIDDPEWTAWAQKKSKENLRAMPELKPLQNKLLSLGGDWVSLQPEPDRDKLLKEGKVMEGNVQLMKREVSRCHANCAALWNTYPDVFKIATGWALSDDGIWRQHTWLLRTSDKTIIETTESRTKYFGIILNDAEANNFWWANR
jgi:hypothetical protein